MGIPVTCMLETCKVYTAIVGCIQCHTAVRMLEIQPSIPIAHRQQILLSRECGDGLAHVLLRIHHDVTFHGRVCRTRRRVSRTTRGVSKRQTETAVGVAAEEAAVGEQANDDSEPVDGAQQFNNIFDEDY